MRMLVVDDDSQFTGHLIAARPSEISVDVVHDTSAAIEYLRDEAPDVIVLDLRMAPMLAGDSANEGLAMLGAIVGGHRGRIPVIIATDSYDKDAEAWCNKLGALAVLHKADGLRQVFDAAREVVQHQQTAVRRVPPVQQTGQ